MGREGSRKSAARTSPERAPPKGTRLASNGSPGGRSPTAIKPYLFNTSVLPVNSVVKYKNHLPQSSSLGEAPPVWEK